MTTEDFMRRAIELSLRSVEAGGGPFGAVIVKDGEIVAEAANSVTRDNDPTAHAEVNAIRIAAQRLHTFDLSGCVIYASCEPCPMCLGAIYWAKLDALYFANTKFDAAAVGFGDKFIYDEIAKSYSQRQLPTHTCLHDEALKAFDLWRNFDGKIEY